MVGKRKVDDHRRHARQIDDVGDDRAHVPRQPLGCRRPIRRRRRRPARLQIRQHRSVRRRRASSSPRPTSPTASFLKYRPFIGVAHQHRASTIWNTSRTRRNCTPRATPLARYTCTANIDPEGYCAIVGWDNPASRANVGSADMPGTRLTYGFLLLGSEVRGLRLPVQRRRSDVYRHRRAGPVSVPPQSHGPPQRAERALRAGRRSRAWSLDVRAGSGKRR